MTGLVFFSPDLFNFYSEMILRNIKHHEGVRVGGSNKTNLRYADDTLLIADSKEILFKGIRIQHVGTFKYLGFTITPDAKYDTDIKLSPRFYVKTKLIILRPFLNNCKLCKTAPKFARIRQTAQKYFKNYRNFA